MPIKTQIEDPATGLVASVLDGIEPNALAVATRPMKVLANNIIPFLNENFGLDMNQNGAVGGIPRIIHDGGDTAAFTATATTGTWDFTSGGVITQAAGENNDIATFTTVSGVNTADYSSITGKITLGIYTDPLHNLLLGVAGNSVDIGTVNLNNYINTGLIGTEQTFLVPRNDLGLSDQVVDEVDILIARSGGAKPTFTLDDLQFESTEGSSKPFVARPPRGTKFHVTKFIISIADNYTGGSSYDKFGDLNSLSIGVNFITTSGGKFTFSTSIHQFSDIYQIGFKTDVELDDGVNTFTSMVYDIDPTNPIVLDEYEGDNMLITINDDLTGLLFLRAFVQGNIETIL